MMQGDILLAARKALLKRVTPNLRAVLVENEQLPFVVSFYYNQEPSDKEKELVHAAYEEFQRSLNVETHLRIINSTDRLPSWILRVYQRYE